MGTVSNKLAQAIGHFEKYTPQAIRTEAGLLLGDSLDEQERHLADYLPNALIETFVIRGEGELVECSVTYTEDGVPCTSRAVGATRAEARAWAYLPLISDEVSG